MVLLESCKGCGASEFKVENKGGYDFLVCSSCKSVVALLSDKKEDRSTIPVSCSGMLISDFQVVSSGVFYTGYLTNSESRKVGVLDALEKHEVEQLSA